MFKLTLKDLRLNTYIVSKLEKIGISTPQELYEKRNIGFEKSEFFNSRQTKKIKDAVHQLEGLGIFDESKDESIGEKSFIEEDIDPDERKSGFYVPDNGYEELNQHEFDDDVLMKNKSEVVSSEEVSVNVESSVFDENLEEDSYENPNEKFIKLNSEKKSRWPEVSLEDNIDYIRRILDESEDNIHIYPSSGLSKSLESQAKHLGMTRMDLIHGLGFVYIWSNKMISKYMLDADKKKFRKRILDAAKNDKNGYITIQPGNEYYSTISGRANRLEMTIDEYCGMHGLIRVAKSSNSDPLKAVRNQAIILASYNVRPKKVKLEKKSETSLDMLLDDNLIDDYVRINTVKEENASLLKELQEQLLSHVDADTLLVDLNSKTDKDFINLFWECATAEHISAGNLLALFGCKRKHLKREAGSYVPIDCYGDYYRICREFSYIIEGWIKSDNTIHCYTGTSGYDIVSQRLDKIDMTIEDFDHERRKKSHVNN